MPPFNKSCWDLSNIRSRIAKPPHVYPVLYRTRVPANHRRHHRHYRNYYYYYCCYCCSSALIRLHTYKLWHSSVGRPAWCISICTFFRARARSSGQRPKRYTTIRVVVPYSSSFHSPRPSARQSRFRPYGFRPRYNMEWDGECETYCIVVLDEIDTA